MRAGVVVVAFLRALFELSVASFVVFAVVVIEASVNAIFCAVVIVTNLPRAVGAVAVAVALGCTYVEVGVTDFCRFAVAVGLALGLLVVAWDTVSVSTFLSARAGLLGAAAT